MLMLFAALAPGDPLEGLLTSEPDYRSFASTKTWIVGGADAAYRSENASAAVLQTVQ